MGIGYSQRSVIILAVVNDDATFVLCLYPCTHVICL